MLITFISPYLIIVPIIIALIILIVVLNISKKGKQVNEVCETLETSNFEIINKNVSKREIKAKLNDENVIIKMITGGKNKGLVITNKDTYFMRLYKDAHSSHIDSWRLDDIKTFVNLNQDCKRIIIVLGGYARITKYINENELEAVTINNDAWGTKVLSLEDFKKYIER